MVALLIEPDRSQMLAPRPTLDVIAALSADADPGPEVEVTIAEPRPDLAATIVSALYRIAQESVTNARRHAPDVTLVSVSLTFPGNQVELTVHNNGALNASGGHAHGYGLIGMAERVRILGGSFSAGPLATGGWLVKAVMAIEAPA
jgi:signal transduction histidine kinase